MGRTAQKPPQAASVSGSREVFVSNEISGQGEGPFLKLERKGGGAGGGTGLEWETREVGIL